MSENQWDESVNPPCLSFNPVEPSLPWLVQAENASRVGVAQNCGGILYGPLPTSTTSHCSIVVGPANMRTLFTYPVSSYAPRLQSSLTHKS